MVVETQFFRTASASTESRPRKSPWLVRWFACRAEVHHLQCHRQLTPPTPSQGTKPHLIAIFADDLGWYDTGIYNRKSPTPRIVDLVSKGVRLDRHYVFHYCSPTRRSFLSGRFPNQITTVQPNVCGDFLPLEFDILLQKLAKAGYVSHFIGKGHLGYETTDHLPINRGFTSHVGFLMGSQSYHWGNGNKNPTKGKHDMWHDGHPETDIVPQLHYATNF